MKVKELIELLEKEDQDAVVVKADEFGVLFPVTEPVETEYLFGKKAIKI